MVTTEQLEEMRNKELKIVQMPFIDKAMRKKSMDYAEALGELIEYREERRQHEIRNVAAGAQV